MHSRSQNVISFNNKSTVLYIFYIKGKQKWALALFRRARISVRLTVDGRALVDVPLDGALPSEIRKMKLKFLLVLMAPIKKLIFIFIMSDLRTRPKLKSSIFNWTLFFSVIVGRRWRKRNFFTKKRGKNREPKFFSFLFTFQRNEKKKTLHKILMTAEKYVFYVSVPTIKKERRETKKIKNGKLSNLHIVQAIQFTSHTKGTSSFLPLNDFIRKRTRRTKNPRASIKKPKFRRGKVFQIKLCERMAKFVHFARKTESYGDDISRCAGRKRERNNFYSGEKLNNRFRARARGKENCVNKRNVV